MYVCVVRAGGLETSLGNDLLVALDLVADLKVLEGLKADAALAALAGLVNVLLDVLERFELAYTEVVRLCTKGKKETRRK